MTSKSIRYFSRETIKDTVYPLTVLELRDFLTRLVAGGHGGLKVLHPARNWVDTNAETTRYTLNDRDNTLILD